MASRLGGGRTVMMGTKVRSFTPLPRDVSLENLVPRDHFYRRLECTLDLSFVREIAASLYAGGVRPSVDHVVFFKPQLIMFFEDLRSERQLMRVVADRLSLRWYLGYFDVPVGFVPDQIGGVDLVCYRRGRRPNCCG